ncbi:MAG: ATP-binding protein [Acidaminococcaceae bacterium]|nr:ATP-binding protein [Acidaminococcaceae bacterium]
MLVRKIEKRIESFYQTDTKALLVTGARQTGKTFTIRAFGKRTFASFIEINFLENPQARTLFENATGSADLLLRISAFADKPLLPHKTLIFFDEVQECKELVTAIKFLVEEGSYRYILSGSLLGVALKDIRSVPVGYMDIYEMYPLDFEEFAIANGVAEQVLENLKNAFMQRIPVDPVVHEKMLELFRLYLVVGGMPAVVAKYLATNNLQEVIREQQAIIALYKKDIAKYDPDNKLYLEDIFDLIPGELNAKNKRFILKRLNENFKFSRYHNSFLWLKDAGVALPTFCVEEPKLPLKLNQNTNLFKLFLSDVGLLAAMYMDGLQIKILNREKDINFGSVYENVAAQELKAHGFTLYYFNSKKQGELDFVIEKGGNALPVEIKSGKDYTRHAALDHVLANEEYAIPEAVVLHNGNVSVKGKVVYYPVYMLMFLQKETDLGDMIYKLNLDVLR